MGYQYPIENYLDLLKFCCTSDTKFIFDVSTDNFNENIFKNYFESINVFMKKKVFMR